MTPVEERLLLLNLYADPSMVKSLVIEADDFSDPRMAQIFLAFKDIPSAIVNVPMLQDWLEEKGHKKAAEEVVAIANDAPITTSVEKIKEYETIIRDNYVSRRLRTFLQRSVEQDDDFDTLSKGILDRVSALSNMRTSSTDQTFAAIKARAGNEPDRDTWPTGIKHIDRVTGGMARGEVWIMSAPYKGYKTRSALNLVINTLCGDKPRSVLYITYDGFDVDLYRSLLSVYVDLPKHCFYGQVDENKWQKWLLEEEEAKKYGDTEKYLIPQYLTVKGNLRELKQHTFSEVRNKLKIIQSVPDLNLRIYDGRHKIDDLNSLQALVMADCLQFNTDLVVIDYVQALAKNREYKELASVASVLQKMAVSNRVALLEISQMSNEDIKFTSDSRLLGTKGSGDFGATADVGIEVYRSDIDVFQIDYVLKVARNAPRLVSRTWINPSTGRWSDDWQLETYQTFLKRVEVKGK